MISFVSTTTRDNLANINSPTGHNVKDTAMFNETATQAAAIAYVQNFALMQRAKIAMRDANSSVVAKTEELENIFQELARYDITMRERQELEQRSVNVAIALQQDCEILEYQTTKMLQYMNEVAKIKDEIVVK